MMATKECNKLADDIVDELTDWSELHGYDIDRNEFLDVALDIAYTIDNPDEFDFLDALHRCQNDGIFSDRYLREFESEYPNQSEYVLAQNGDGRIGIFFDDTFGLCGRGYKQIRHEDVPLNWFKNYQVFDYWDI